MGLVFRRAGVSLVCLFCWLLPAQTSLRFEFDEENTRWRLANGVIEAVFQLSPEGAFQLVEMKHLASGDAWKTGGSNALFRFRIDDKWQNAQTGFFLLSQQSQPVARGGRRQTIVLMDAARTMHLAIDIEMYTGEPVLRYGTRFLNLSGARVHVTGVDMLPWDFSGGGDSYDALRVEQWHAAGDPADFQTHISPLAPTGEPVSVDSGAHGRFCGWMALAAKSGRGLIAGWEFDGRATATASHWADQDKLALSAAISGIHHPVEPEEEFPLPKAFLGLFHGSWDEAGYVTQRFVETALAKRPEADGKRIDEFPYVSWDSWRYGQDLNEATLRRNADIASRIGVELFVVDLGWARSIGNWHADTMKFPNGLGALSDYVHSLGMKFGLHFAFAESSATAPVLRQNPDWTSSSSYGYYGAESLCLSHQPVKEWIIGETIRIIDEYNVDWILQDGENMVKECRKSTHTHHPLDSNYSNAVDGLGAVLKEVQRRRPNVLWENCENGGNLMTFQMVQNYVTSIVNDASGARGSRESVFGATFPFPARYADRYMPEEELGSYQTRSYMFGGPWIFMNRLTEMSTQAIGFAALEIARYKQMRPVFDSARIIHLLPPMPGFTDAIAAYEDKTGRGVAVVTRDGSSEGTTRIVFSALDRLTTYRVSFADDPSTLTLTGAQLMTDGLLVRLPGFQSAEIVYLDAMR
ncbi:MAG: alpha-galactosidase [Acidobacteriia bacterium]|nr:alpha-galactosidase [Terriglobia bacterium]